MSNPSLTQRYLNATVTVYYHTNYSDSGRIIYLDNHWIELVKPDGELLLIPTAGIRLVKLQPQAGSSDANTLVRASAPINPQEEKK